MYTIHTTVECVLSKHLKVLTSVLLTHLLHMQELMSTDLLKHLIVLIDKTDPKNPRVTDEVHYFTADEEDDFHVAQANAEI